MKDIWIVLFVVVKLEWLIISCEIKLVKKQTIYAHLEALVVYILKKGLMWFFFGRYKYSTTKFLISDYVFKKDLTPLSV